MTSYTKSTDFAAKDALLSGNPSKLVKGTEINTEFVNIQTAVNSKLDSAGVTAFAATLLDDATAGTARATLGSTTVGDAVFIAATAANGRSALVAAASGANTDITSLGNNTSTVYTTGGTSTAYTITPSPVIAAYAIGQSFFVNFNAACGAAPTLTISGVATPPNLVKENSDGTFSNLSANDIPSNHRSRVTLISTTQALVEKMPKVVTADITDAAITAAKLSGAQTGSAPVYGCRAWAIFDGTLTGTNAPTAGGNVTSITRNSTGNYTVNISTALPSANYAVLITCKATDTNSYMGDVVEGTTPTTSAVQIRTNSHTSTLTDLPRVFVAILC